MVRYYFLPLKYQIKNKAMDILQKIETLSKNIGLRDSRGISFYGSVGDVNVRISDHMPKVHNLIDYALTLKKNSNGVVELALIVFCEEQEDSFESFIEDLEEDLSEEIECEVEISLTFLSEEDVLRLDLNLDTLKAINPMFR